MGNAMIKDGKIVEPVRELKVLGHYDVVVAGGGIAGFGAAVAAARKGCKTLLIERTTCLGGLATVGLVPIPMDIQYGISREMLDNLNAVNGHWHRNTDPEKHKRVLDRMLINSGCDLLLDSFIVDAIMEGDTLRGLVVESKSGREAILGKRFIDCTGDADLAYFAGAECFSGRSSDGKHQACSVDFRLGGVDFDKYLNSDLKKNDPVWIELIKESVANGTLPYMIENHVNWITHVPGRPQHCGQDEICFCISHSRNCDPLSARDLTRMYLEGREQAEIHAAFIRKCIPGFENSFLVDTATLLEFGNPVALLVNMCSRHWTLHGRAVLKMPSLRLITILIFTIQMVRATSSGRRRSLTARSAMSVPQGTPDPGSRLAAMPT